MKFSILVPIKQMGIIIVSWLMLVNAFAIECIQQGMQFPFLFIFSLKTEYLTYYGGEIFRF